MEVTIKNANDKPYFGELPADTPAVLQDIAELARENAFDLIGVTSAQPPDHGPAFTAWLRAGMHARMDWLERQEQRILDPREVLPGARTVLCLAAGHARAPAGFRDGGRVARFAAHRDYHNVLGKRLRRIARELLEKRIAGAARAIVDAGPLLERDLAARAGLGFIGKSSNLLHPRFGPWLFLAEILIDRDLPALPPAESSISCGRCIACIEDCPTGAIVSDRVVDARRCISYWTIEHRGFIPIELRPLMHDWVFGCDVCSTSCPFGHRAPGTGMDYGEHPALDQFSLQNLLALRDETYFREAFAGSALRRCGREGLLRNAAIALANMRQASARNALVAALEDPSAVVRGHCAWALSRLAPGQHRWALNAALNREDDPVARAEIAGAIAAVPDQAN